MNLREDETKRKKDLLKVIYCFKGPVHHAFVYTYYQSYTQNTDMYNYALNTNKQTQFTEKEFLVLEHERRPNKLNFFHLYKVIQNCCSPTLAEYNDSIWSFNNTESSSQGLRVEQILASLANSYKTFLQNTDKLSVDEINILIENLEKNVILLIKKSAEFSNSKRWTEERENMQKRFSSIKNGDFMSCAGISDIVRMEAEFRTDLNMELLSMELNNVDVSSWHFQLCDDPEGGDEEKREYSKIENIEAEEILGTMREQRKRICWISGEHGVGKSSFAALIASIWALKGKEIRGLKEMSAVFVISLSSSLNNGEKDVFEMLLPLTRLMINRDLLESWLIDENVLLILDDVSKHSSEIVKCVYKAIEYFPKLTVWLMGRISSTFCYTNKANLMSEALLFELKGLKEERVLSLSKALCEPDADNNTLKMKLKTNMNRLGYVMKYPSIAFMTFKLWQDNAHVFKNVYTASDLMWEILHWKVKRILKVNIKKIGPARKKFFNWLMLAGELALYSLKADLRLDKQSLEELETEIVSLYKDNGREFLNSFFKPSICHSSASCFTIKGSTSKPLLEYLSSWFFIDQLIQNKQMSQLTNGLVNQLPLILFAAGHLERFQDEGTITIPEERKLIRALVTYKENSYDDFSFIQMFVAELKCIKRLVEIVIDETEYNEEWNLNVSEIQHKSLEVLLNHVSPTRLILLADESKKNYEMTDVIKYICRVKISVWLDSVPQFNYGNAQNLDNLLKPFLAELVVPKIDLISGCLSSSMLSELHKFSATQHLVLLKLKVSSNQHLNDALNVLNHLQHLLWLELKVDMNFNDIEVSNIEPNRVSLFDIHLRQINETNVTFVADLLASIQVRCTGIHLEETTLTPEGVFTLLKELGKRSVTLHGDEESIMKFRLWYYPPLSSLPTWKTPTEAECVELIGHDDREFFSDHHVVSSRFVTAIDAWNLRNYLEGQKNIIHFVYETSNIIFKKCLDGHVKIRFKGDYKETIEDKVLDKAHSSSENEIENNILEFF